MRALRLAAIAAAVLTFALIVLGATVRATGSGLSCPDWPTCYGHWLPLPSQIAAMPQVGYSYTQVMLEWVHRLIAGMLLGPLVLVIAVLAFLARRHDRRLPVIGIGLILLLLVQAALGAVTVLDANSPWSVALHLGNAQLVLALLLLLVERTSPALHKAPPATIAVLSVIAWCLALSAMIAAAITAKSGAALACSTWPSCNGAWLPDLSDPLVRIHFAHRVLAAATALALLVLWRLTKRTDREVHTLARRGAFFVVVQVGVGALVVLWQVPLTTAVVHQALGVLVFVMATRLMWLAVRPPTPRKETVHGLALSGA